MQLLAQSHTQAHAQRPVKVRVCHFVRQNEFKLALPFHCLIASVAFGQLLGSIQRQPLRFQVLSFLR